MRTVAALLLAGGLLVGLPQAAVAQESCNGNPATVVGTPGGALVGTTDRDLDGTSGPNDLRWNACVGVFGCGGKDRLSGSPWADILIGGRGFDRGDGRGGIDRCRVERPRNCELDRWPIRYWSAARSSTWPAWPGRSTTPRRDWTRSTTSGWGPRRPGACSASTARSPSRPSSGSSATTGSGSTGRTCGRSRTTSAGRRATCTSSTATRPRCAGGPGSRASSPRPSRPGSRPGSVPSASARCSQRTAATRRRAPYGLRTSLERSALLVDLTRAAERAGRGIEQVHMEYGQDQLEVSLSPTDPVSAADDVVLARIVIGRGRGAAGGGAPSPDSDDYVTPVPGVGRRFISQITSNDVVVEHLPNSKHGATTFSVGDADGGSFDPDQRVRALVSDFGDPRARRIVTGPRRDGVTS